jgi:ribosomal 30S subunit maturation factor RimM
MTSDEARAPSPTLAAADRDDGRSEGLALGFVGRAHGLKGAFFVAGRSEAIPSSYGPLRVGASWSEARLAKILESRVAGGGPILRLDLASSREAIEPLRGQRVFAARSAVRATQGRGALWCDLEGADVEDAAGVRLGRVLRVYNVADGAPTALAVADTIELRGDDGRLLAVPMVEAFFGPGALAAPVAGERYVLRLVVPAETFADAWQDAAPPPKTPRVER